MSSMAGLVERLRVRFLMKKRISYTPEAFQVGQGLIRSVHSYSRSGELYSIGRV